MMPSGRFVTAGLIGFLFLCGYHVSSADTEGELSVKSVAPGTHSFAILVKGVERGYLVHIPPSYDHAKKWPVVVMFHGGGGTAKDAMSETGWTAKADKEGFLSVFPEGTRSDPTRPPRFRGNPQSWNDGSKRPQVRAARREVADVEFVSMMLSDLKRRYSVDERRIYATGFSNGASMTFRVARELSPLIAAVAPVAGADWLADETPTRPVPLLYFTGTADPGNPFEGGEVRIGAWSFGKKPPTREMIGRWVKLHGCPEVPRVVYDKDGAQGVAYGLPGQPAKVVLYTIAGHGHHWPGGKSTLPESLAGKNTAKLKATDVIWAFFKAHSIADKTGAQQDAPAEAGKLRS